MPHTPLLSAIANLARRIANEQTPEPALSRRAFLATAAALPLAAAPQPRVVIVGAGLAGLTCGYRLAQSGIHADIYDANARLGGRCWTVAGAFDEGQIIERGGELIDSTHIAIRRLCQEFGLVLDNLFAADPPGTEAIYYFDGAPYSLADADRDFRAIWPKLRVDLRAAGYPTTYNQSTPRGRVLDRMSITDWLNESVPGGASSRLGQLLDVAYNIEYGDECSLQSALNIVYVLGYTGPGQLRLFGTSNEKFRVRGGNSQIASRLAAPLAARIRTGYALSALGRNPDGSYTLTFRVADNTQQVQADRVVLALPFSMLRTLDYSGAGFSPLKSAVIQQQGFGSNAKLHMQFRTRYWYQLGGNGDSYSDNGYQCAWDASRGQAGTSGLLINFTGGNLARNAASISPALALSTIEPVMPGLTAQWNGKSDLQDWPANPFSRGSYSYWKPGQFSTLAGAESEVEGNCHFCGEHTSYEYQGYLNGAVDSGERAAAEIQAALAR